MKTCARVFVLAGMLFGDCLRKKFFSHFFLSSKRTSDSETGLDVCHTAEGNTRTAKHTSAHTHWTQCDVLPKQNRRDEHAFHSQRHGRNRNRQMAQRAHKNDCDVKTTLAKNCWAKNFVEMNLRFLTHHDWSMFGARAAGLFRLRMFVLRKASSSLVR